ncbi:MAG: hypothetical protein V3W20_09210 [Candidatus Neomarinimicrobiota bacterium]
MLIRFLLLLLIFTIPAAFAVSTTSELTIINNRISFPNNEIILNNESLKISEYNIFEKDFTKKVIFVTENNGNEITMINSVVSEITVVFSDETELSTVSSTDSSWDGTISLTESENTSSIITGYEIPDRIIKIGNDNLTIQFDKAVTIIFKNMIGDAVYKQTGATNWNLISTCQGTYDTPTDPGVRNMCYITDGVNTKIITYHFTEFAILEETDDGSSSGGNNGSSSGGNSGGSSGGGQGRTGVGPTNTPNTIPQWVKQPTVWWINEDITNTEFSNMMEWLIDNDVIEINYKTKPNTEIFIDIPLYTKNLFSQWEQGNLSESIILDIIEKYRMNGIW